MKVILIYQLEKNENSEGDLLSLDVYSGGSVNLTIRSSGNGLYNVTGKDSLDRDISEKNIEISEVSKIIQRWS